VCQKWLSGVTNILCILATVLQHRMVDTPHINCSAAAKTLGIQDLSEAQINTGTNTPLTDS